MSTAYRAPMLWLAAALALGASVGAGTAWVSVASSLLVAGSAAALARRPRGRAWVPLLVLLAAFQSGSALRAAADARSAEVVSQVDGWQQRPNPRFEGTVEKLVARWPVPRVEVRLVRAHAMDGRAPLAARALVSLPAGTTAPREGDTLLFRATLRPPRRSAFTGDYDARTSLAARGVDLVGSVHDLSDVAVVDDHSFSSIATDVVNTARARTHELAARVLPDDAAALVGAFVLGDSSGLDDGLRRTFDAAGASHLLAVSGLQATLLAAIFFVLLRAAWGRVPWLLRRADPAPAAATLSIPAIFLYAAFAGGASSVMRSAWMATAVMAARALGRPAATAQALGVAAWIMVLLEPRVVHDVGFQLSFLSVLALVLVAPGMERAIAGGDTSASTSTSKARAAVAASTAAYLASLPLVASLFGRVAAWGAVSNLVLVPLGAVALPLIVVLAIGATLLDSAFLMQVAGALCMAVHDACIPFAALPGALVDVRPAPPWAVVLGLVALVVAGFGTRRTLVMGMIGVVACTAAGLMPSWWQPDALVVHAAPVGQGDGFILRTPHGRTIVVDAGGSFLSSVDPGKTVMVPLLDRMGVDRVDVMVLSHPHPDHQNGLVTVAERFKPKEFWFNGMTSPAPRFTALMDALRAQGAALTVFEPGADGVATRELDGVRFEVLHPFPPRDGPDAPSYFPELDANDNSLVFRACYAGRCVLMAGDVEAEAERMLTGDQRVRSHLRADVLKVPHHGSNTSTTDEWLDAVAPTHALIGVGERNPWRFPHPDVLGRLARRRVETWRTDEDGLVTVELSAAGVRAWAFRR